MKHLKLQMRKIAFKARQIQIFTGSVYNAIKMSIHAEPQVPHFQLRPGFNLNFNHPVENT